MMNNKLLVSVICVVTLILTSCKDDSPPSSSSILAIGERPTAIIRSTDAGRSWSRAVVSSTGLTGKLKNIKFLNGKWWAMGGGLSTSLLLVSDDDGVTWQKVETPDVAQICDIAYGDGTYIAVGRKENIIVSTDGTTWSRAEGLEKIFPPEENVKKEGALYKIVYGQNIFVVVATYLITFEGVLGNEGVILESKDKGVTWRRDDIRGNGYTDIIYAGGAFLAVGSGEVAYNSGNGWKHDNRSGQPGIFSPLLHNGTNFVVIGQAGLATVKVTFGNFDDMTFGGPDNWQPKSHRHIKSIRALMYGNGTHVYAGASDAMFSLFKDQVDGALLATSTDNGESWHSQQSKLDDSLLGSKAAITTGVFAQNRFIVSGDKGKRDKTVATVMFTSDDGLTWIKSQLPSLTNDERIIKIATGD